MNKYILRIIVIAVGILISSICLPNRLQLPPGWRVPTNAELQDRWREDDTNKYASVKGDFNGDNIVDEAKILLSDKPPGFALFAFLFQKNGTYKTYLLDKKENPTYIRALGIRKVTPGRYKTACGKGIIDCRKGELSEVLLNYDAIEYFKVESASMFFYWDNLTKTFKKAWIDD